MSYLKYHFKKSNFQLLAFHWAEPTEETLSKVETSLGAASLTHPLTLTLYRSPKETCFH